MRQRILFAGNTPIGVDRSAIDCILTNYNRACGLDLKGCGRFLAIIPIMIRGVDTDWAERCVPKMRLCAQCSVASSAALLAFELCRLLGQLLSDLIAKTPTTFVAMD